VHRPSDVEFVQVAVDIAGEPADQAGEVLPFPGRPVGEQRGEPLMTGEEEPLDRLLPLLAEPQQGRPRVLGVPGPADQAQAFESLGLAGDRGSVDAQPFGQVGDAQADLFRVQRVEDRQAGLVDASGSTRWRRRGCCRAASGSWTR
jgi:hypothetical protein